MLIFIQKYKMKTRKEILSDLDLQVYRYADRGKYDCLTQKCNVNTRDNGSCYNAADIGTYCMG
jgi:hypothetical protein